MEQSLENEPIIERAYISYNKTKEAQEKIIINAINSAIQEGKTDVIIDIKGSDIVKEIIQNLQKNKYYIDLNVFNIYISWKPREEKE